MPTDPPDTSDRDVSTPAEFDSALQALLRSAIDNGVDPRGAWEWHNSGAHPDLEIVVSELVT